MPVIIFENYSSIFIIQSYQIVWWIIFRLSDNQNENDDFYELELGIVRLMQLRLSSFVSSRLKPCRWFLFSFCWVISSTINLHGFTHFTNHFKNGSICLNWRYYRNRSRINPHQRLGFFYLWPIFLKIFSHTLELIWGRIFKKMFERKRW